MAQLFFFQAQLLALPKYVIHSFPARADLIFFILDAGIISDRSVCITTTIHYQQPHDFI